MHLCKRSEKHTQDCSSAPLMQGQHNTESLTCLDVTFDGFEASVGQEP